MRRSLGIAPIRFGRCHRAKAGPRLNRQDAFAYLRAESACLVEEGQALRRELETLMGAPFDIKACLTYYHKLRAYRGLLANHALALRWTMHPPHISNAPLLPTVSERSATLQRPASGPPKAWESARAGVGVVIPTASTGLVANLV